MLGIYHEEWHVYNVYLSKFSSLLTPLGISSSEWTYISGDIVNDMHELFSSSFINHASIFEALSRRGSVFPDNNYLDISFRALVSSYFSETAHYHPTKLIS
jgi:hypothetical protein